MINHRILPNGDLLITTGNSTRAFIAAHLERGYWSTLGEIFEHEACNGGLTPFEPGDGETGPFVGLTSAPCIAESLAIDDRGRQSVEGRVWWYPDYATQDPLDDLKNRGRAVFTLAP